MYHVWTTARVLTPAALAASAMLQSDASESNESAPALAHEAKQSPLNLVAWGAAAHPSASRRAVWQKVDSMLAPGVIARPHTAMLRVWRHES